VKNLGKGWSAFEASVPHNNILHDSDGSSCIIGFNPQKAVS